MKPRHYRYSFPMIVTALLLVAVSAFADEPPVGDHIHFTGVELRPGVEVDIHLAVFGEIDKGCQVAIHGFIHTAASWQPYADAVGGCVLAIDLPGRGGSSLPTGLLYGDLLLDDHVTAILTTLERLEEELDIEPTTIVGHSQGGLLIEMAQERLLAQGSNLEHRFDIREAILLAAAPPAEVPTFLFDSGAGLELFESFLVDDPERGPVIALPAAILPALIFTNSSGQLVAGAPTSEEIVAAGWNAPSEPYLATLQLVGGHGFARASVRAGAFSEEPRLRVLGFEEDLIILPGENIELYRHLTGDDDLDCATVVAGPDAVHDGYVSDPGGVAVAIAALENCGY